MKGTGRENDSIQKLLGLQCWPRRRLGGCTHPRIAHQRERGCANLPVGLFRLLHWLGIDDNCPLRLSAPEAVGGEPQLGVMSSIGPPRGIEPPTRSAS